MEKIVWDEKFNVGVDIIDKAHAKLFRIIHKMIDLSQDTSTTQHTCKEMLKYLETYSMTHFSEEEAYMRSIRYSGYAQHKQIHDNFRDKTLVSLKKELEQSGYSSSAIQHLTDTMQSWLAGHIMKVDQAIVKKSGARKGYDCSSQSDLISRAVHRAIQDVCQTEVKLITADYKGENIGSGFYCQQTYDIEGRIRLRLLLGMEEPLILRGIEKIYGKRKLPVMPANKPTDELLLQVFEKLFEHMGTFFQGEAVQALEKDNLLERDEFRAAFMKGYPCSLLFGSKLGYFIFCYRTWRVKK
ncbi:MAG: hemerythrin family protein [Lachnospiraceae bacterium]|jgi:hemerythrin-like metal-binding protein|nr:hemerythrin family protein [Lachnospiraceae bacterium]